MSTIDDIANWVTQDELKRSDLTAESRQKALDFYKVLCYNIPFEELQTTSGLIPTVTGQTDYDLATLVPDLKAIYQIQIQFSSTQKRRLRRSHIRVYRALSFSQSSRPATYARWGLKIMLNPPPNSSGYNLLIDYWKKPTIAAPIQDTTIATPDEWNNLIKYETLYRVLLSIGQSARAAELIAQPFNIAGKTPNTGHDRMMNIGIIPRLWNELLTTISQKENGDEDFSINPVVRNYSYRGR